MLPILVRQADANQEITYGNLGKELDLHHRVLRHLLDCIGNTLLELSEQWQENIPPIPGSFSFKNLSDSSEFERPFSMSGAVTNRSYRAKGVYKWT